MIFLLGGFMPVYGQDISASYPETVQNVVTDYLKRETAGFPGSVQITVPTVMFNQRMAACTNLSATMEDRARRFGTVAVKVSCMNEKNFSIFVQANIKIFATYYVYARQLTARHLVQAEDVTTTEGDVSGFFDSAVFDASAVVGKELKFSVAQGLPVRKAQLRNQLIVRSGQKVRVIYSDPGFSVSVVGTAMFDGGIGDVIQVRTDSGKVISGVVSSDGNVAIR